MTNIFKKAAANKLRFTSSSGSISVEDLFDLPLTSAKSASLDQVARNISKELKGQEEESFVEVSSNPLKAVLELKLEIVKEVIADRKALNEARVLAAEKADKKQKILAIMASKQDEALQGMSLEDLEKELESL